MSRVLHPVVASMRLAVFGGRRPRSLRDCRRGATMVEFALVFIPFMSLLLAILQTAILFFAQQTLDTVAEKATRVFVTGSAQKSNMTAAQFKKRACSVLPVHFRCADLMIDVRSAPKFSDVNLAAPDITYDTSGKPTGFAYTPGDSSQITIVRMMYIWRTPMGLLGFDLSNMSKGRRLLIATQVFKAEKA